MPQNRWQTYCPGCGRFLLREPASSGSLPCQDCGFQIEYVLLPAATQKAAPARAATRAEGESPCFNHPLKRAERECSVCGKYLCALCSVQFGPSHVCPECLMAGRKSGAKARDLPPEVSATLVQNRFVPGAAAFSIAAIGSLLFFASIATAPVSLALGIYGLYRPGSLVSSSRVSAIIAIVLSVIQIGIWIVVFVS